MRTAKLTLDLPEEDLRFAERYAQALQITVSELVDRYIRRLRAQGLAESVTDKRLEDDAWSELFRVGDALAASDSSSSESMTAAVVAMRR